MCFHQHDGQLHPQTVCHRKSYRETEEGGITDKRKVTIT